MEFNHDVHLVTNCLANLLKGFESTTQFGRADMQSSVVFSSMIEGPDLHRLDSLLQKAQRQFIRSIEEGIQVFVGAFFAIKPPVVCGLYRTLPNIAITRTSIVDTNLLTG